MRERHTATGWLVALALTTLAATLLLVAALFAATNHHAQRASRTQPNLARRAPPLPQQQRPREQPQRQPQPEATPTPQPADNPTQSDTERAESGPSNDLSGGLGDGVSGPLPSFTDPIASLWEVLTPFALVLIALGAVALVVLLVSRRRSTSVARGAPKAYP
ncbi:MAG: DUF1180 domain-containing protein [Candidatus Eremiobacteraeota bacterium]|nr:DUF1180 domain-containing protein [Candidatus Eremiobacteraeota bacterium]